MAGLVQAKLALGAATVALSVFTGGAARAQTGSDVADPPVLQEQPAAAGAALAGAAPTRSNEAKLDLTVEYVDGTIYDPSERRYDKVRLRSYTRNGVPAAGAFVSPTIRTRPGETVRVNLRNRLDPDPSCAGGGHGDPNVPHCFNGTNLHTHGLWVNPAGNGDNVLLSINPGVSFEYEFGIPEEHPAGTFWYHTHRHGSTALQVSSGMAGALIIEGRRPPSTTRHGDLDTLLRGFRDRVMVMQQIQYACRGPSVDGKLGPIKKKPDGTYRCDPGDVGGVESYDELGFKKWPASGRFTSINGLILPTFAARQGKVERWRLIHAGIYDTISLQFIKAKKTDAQLPGGRNYTTARMGNLIADTCKGDPIRYHLAAADGLTLDAVQPATTATFQAGYRYDALIAFPEAGSYCVIDASAPASGTMPGSPVGPRLLGMVRVFADTPVADPDKHLADVLAAAAEQNMPADVRPAIVADLRDKLKLTRFTSELHPDIAAGDVDAHEELSFVIGPQAPGIKGNTFMVSNKLLAVAPPYGDPVANPYKPDRVDRKLVLGDTSEWVLTSPVGGHPFHIHVNPFQVIEILDKNGNDVSGFGASDGGDPQYPGLRNVWKDTLWVKPGYKVKIRTRYQRYIGEFVLHCHILDHEDQGMMQNVAIVLPGGTPASVNAPEEAAPPAGHSH